MENGFPSSSVPLTWKPVMSWRIVPLPSRTNFFAFGSESTCTSRSPELYVPASTSARTFARSHSYQSGICVRSNPFVSTVPGFTKPLTVPPPAAVVFAASSAVFVSTSLSLDSSESGLRVQLAPHASQNSFIPLLFMRNSVPHAGHW